MAALPGGDRGGPRARARDDRRGAGDLRRRTAADAWVHHRHLRPRVPAAADAGRAAATARRALRASHDARDDGRHDGPARAPSRVRRRRHGARRRARHAVIGVEHEAARPPAGDGFVDAVTVSWGDRGADLYGLARIGLGAEGASALAVMFSGREPVAAVARDGLATDGADWVSVQAGGLAMATAAPLERWTVRFASEDGRHGFEFELEAASEPAVHDDAFARSGGMEGYEQLCVARGSVLVDGETR